MCMCRADFSLEVSVVLGLETLHVTLGGMVCFEDNVCTQPFIPQLMINVGFWEARANVGLSPRAPLSFLRTRLAWSML